MRGDTLSRLGVGENTISDMAWRKIDDEKLKRGLDFLNVLLRVSLDGDRAGTLRERARGSTETRRRTRNRNPVVHAGDGTAAGNFSYAAATWVKN